MSRAGQPGIGRGGGRAHTDVSPTGHSAALGVAAGLAVASVWSALGGSQLAVLVLAFVGLAPAMFLLLTRSRPSDLQLGLWAAGAVVTAVAALLLLGNANQERSAMLEQDACPLPALRFEVQSASTVGVDWWPPRVLCEYRYSIEVPDEIESQQRWWIYWPFAVVPLAVVLVAGTVRQLMTRGPSVALGSPVTPPGRDPGAGILVAGSAEAHRQAAAVAGSRDADDDQAFIDELSDLDEE